MSYFRDYLFYVSIRQDKNLPRLNTQTWITSCYLCVEGRRRSMINDALTGLCLTLINARMFTNDQFI